MHLCVKNVCLLKVMDKMQLTVSIVLYNNDLLVLNRTIDSVLESSSIAKLYLIDNSPSPLEKDLISDDRIQYIFLNSNRGFGAGHNVVLNRSLCLGKYHLVLNPDVYFSKGCLEKLCEYMDANPDVGNVMPRIVYPSGELQHLCKLLPTPTDWIVRMFIPIQRVKNKIDYNFEMRFADYDQEMNVPYLSGCFMFLRKSVIEEIGVFDERIFMYGEDTDLNRRIHQKYRTMYYPQVTITHNFEKGSHKSLRLFWIHVKAAIYYLNKWGWFFDKERTLINEKIKAIHQKK